MQDNALYLHSLIMVKLLPIPDSKSYHAEKLFFKLFQPIYQLFVVLKDWNE